MKERRKERMKERRLRKIMRKRKSKNAVQKEVGLAKIELEWEMKKREKT